VDGFFVGRMDSRAALSRGAIEGRVGAGVWVWRVMQTCRFGSPYLSRVMCRHNCVVYWPIDVFVYKSINARLSFLAILLIFDLEAWCAM
jgi:hypothetical protein